MRRIAKQDGWTQKRARVEHSVDTKIVNAVSDKEAKKAIDIIDVADKLLAKLSELMDNVPLDTQSFKQLTSALKDLKDIKGYKSAIDLKEQEARIAKLERDASASNMEDDRPCGIVLLPPVPGKLMPPNEEDDDE